MTGSWRAADERVELKASVKEGGAFFAEEMKYHFSKKHAEDYPAYMEDSPVPLISAQNFQMYRTTKAPLKSSLEMTEKLRSESLKVTRSLQGDSET